MQPIRTVAGHRCRAILAALLFSPPAVAGPVLEMSKTVDNAVPLPGQPVEFTIEIVNTGDDTLRDVEIEESLPPGLEIPPGLAVFSSSGDYDPVTGFWYAGDLEPGATATLVVPAVVDGADRPACLVNVARSNFMGGQWPFAVEGRAAVRGDAGTRCVDLRADFGVRVGDLSAFPECDKYDRYYGSATISNFGPDTARDVVVTIGQQPVVGPNLRFQDADCASAASAQCRIGELAPFESVDIDVTSDPFQSYEAFTQTISVSAVTSDVDYDASNSATSGHGTAGGFSSCAQPYFGDSFGGAIGPGCFIATAAYGSPMHEHVETLRRFRDRFLLPNQPGRAFVRFYYRYSPAAARYLSSRPWLRAVVRWALAPLVYTIAWPAMAIAWPMTLAGAVLWRRRLLRIRYSRDCHEGGPLTG